MRKWHVVMRVGPADDYAWELSLEAPTVFAALERPGDPDLVRENALELLKKKAPQSPSPVVLDLLTLALAVFTADVRIPRDTAEDRWTRNITLHLPVFDLSLWQGVYGCVRETLNFLTGDVWEISFRERRPSGEAAPRRRRRLFSEFSSTCLFSGGLDSLVGAINLLQAGERVALVAHHGAGTTNSVQQNVLGALQANYPGQIVPCMFHVIPRKRAKADSEQSMRSRSFLFLSLGAAVSSAFEKTTPLHVSENGFISLNVPLTSSRLGSLSTRTTHPYFIRLFRDMLSRVGLPVEVQMPGLFLTKGEMLRGASNQAALQSIAPLTMSCSHPDQGRYRKVAPGNHCGHCVPCIVRRASVLAAGLPDAGYDTDILQKNAVLTKNTGNDLRSFLMAAFRFQKSPPSKHLFDVLSTGPLEPELIDKYISVYQNGMAEISSLLSRRA
jgi:hypothetical protein